MPVPSDTAIASSPVTYELAAVISPSDTANIPLTRGIWITHNGSGNIKVRMANGDDVTFNWHAATTIFLPIRCYRVFATGTTTAANFVAMY